MKKEPEYYESPFVKSWINFDIVIPVILRVGEIAVVVGVMKLVGLI